jgi:gamma-glutamylcyclotransferase (GGCT)/AIG2-like uncharacterized protein YtfP
VAGRALFVYGSLISEARLRALTARSFPRRPARLDGFERITPPNGYPYIVPKPGSAIEGWLIEDVDPASLARLDAYEDEGRLYLRRPAEVTASGVRVACETYVGNVPADPAGGAPITGRGSPGHGRTRCPASGG